MTPGDTYILDREVDGRWIAEAEDVPGAMAYGDSPGEAVLNAATIAARTRELISAPDERRTAP